MKILHVAAEAIPFASSGGLGDVIGSLPSALNRLDDVDARVVMPLYGTISEEYRSRMTFLGSKEVKLAWRKQYCGLFSLVHGGVTFYFIDNEYYFKRERLYGEFDDGERFAFFCRAALEILPDIGFFPDVLHAHDWHAALSVIYLKRCYQVIDERYAPIRSVMTIHNIQYQGVYDFSILGDVFGLMSFDRETVECGGSINLLKGGIVCADRVTTVSPSYSREILTPEYSSGLDKVLNDYSFKLYGILNGIDVGYYNPATDGEIAAKYSYRRPDGKKLCAQALCDELGLQRGNAPILAVVSRLVGHKGVDILMPAAEELLQKDVRLVVLGTGEKRYEDFFRGLEKRRPDKCRTLIKYDKSLSKRVYAAADIFIMPSYSEPCGLAQMIAARYGAIPVVHETGGLRDSIKDVTLKNGIGFTFAGYSASELSHALDRAVGSYEFDRDTFESVRLRAMRTDFSWKRSALNYKELYQNTINFQ